MPENQTAQTEETTTTTIADTTTFSDNEPSHSIPDFTGPATTFAGQDTLPRFQDEKIPYPPGLRDGEFGVKSVSSVNGKLAYILYEGDKQVLISGGTEIGSGRNIEYITDINGRIAYVLQKSEGDKTVIVYDGKEFGREYSSAFGPFSLAGKLAYTALVVSPKDDNSFPEKTFIVYEGKEIGKEYSSVFSPAEVNGKLAYVAYNSIIDQDTHSIIVHDGRIINEEYYNIEGLREVNGKLAYIAVKKEDRGDYLSDSGNGIERFRVVYDGKEEDRSYQHINEVKWIGGKLAYIALEEGQYFFVYDGKEGGKEYINVRSLMEFRGKLLYIATLDIPEGIESPSPVEALIWNGIKITEDYEEIVNSPVLIDGKLVFAAKKWDGNWYWIKEK